MGENQPVGRLAIVVINDNGFNSFLMKFAFEFTPPLQFIYSKVSLSEDELRSFFSAADFVTRDST